MKINRASSGAEERRNGFQGSLTRFRNLLVAVAILPGGTNVAVPVGLLSFYSLTFANESVAQAVTQKSGVSLSKNSKLVQNQAGFYRMNVGDIDVIALSDGTVGLGVL